MVAVISQQSAALTSLMAHLASGDALGDFQGSSSSSSVSTKGAMRRKKMQQELAGRTSQFFLQVQQQIFKKIYPAKMCPKTEEELVKSQVSISSYFKEVRRLQGPARNGPNDVDACLCNGFSISRRFLCCKEIPGVDGCSSMEQSVLDGHWQIAYVVGLLEEPPAQLLIEKLQSTTALGRPFSPLVPPSWAAASFSYLKEIALLSTKKGEIVSPKRRPRFPKRPKSGNAPKAS